MRSKGYGGRVIELRTDALTRPTQEMWAAMHQAELGWAMVKEDDSVNALLRLAAELTGKEAGLFVPTGTMANLVALLTHTSRGDQVILDRNCHILCCETEAIAHICGLLSWPVTSERGHPKPHQIRDAILRSQFSHSPTTGVVCLENSHNANGGTVITGKDLAEIAAVAHEFGVPVHLDGARVLNACEALGEKLRKHLVTVDSLMFNLNKGLSAPYGAVLCGTREFIAQCIPNLQRLGGWSVSKAGMAAAAGCVALRTMIPQLAEDNRRARLLAEELSQLAWIEVDLATVQTNIIMVEVRGPLEPAGELRRALEKHGIRVHLVDEKVLRFVTHRHISDESVEQTVAVIQKLDRHGIR